MALPASQDALLVSETFVSLQGEGASVGAPAAFLRLGNCNLACSYCDTPYTWDEVRFDLHEELRATSLDEVATWLLAHAPGRVIVTGGEPLLQHQKLARLLVQVDSAWHSATAATERLYVEVETNGTVLPGAALLERVNQWNVSPKLACSGEPAERRLKPQVVEGFVRTGRAYFKFVIASEADVHEVRALVHEWQLPEERVLLMPEARTASELRERSAQVAAWALRERMRFSGRLHLELYGGRRGT